MATITKGNLLRVSKDPILAGVMQRMCIIGALAVCALASPCATTAATVELAGYPTGSFRWMDTARNVYGAAYRGGYSYTQASVVITCAMTGTVLTGTMSATNLKPNFTYQLKLSGFPEADPTSNINLGLAGRWWKEDWNGSSWANGWNLNNKGNGSFPNPNDDWYFANRDATSATSPTGKAYRFTGYRPFDYFITDEQGNAVLGFAMMSAYHVLYKTDQRVRSSSDGPIKHHAFDPDPSAHDAYDTNYPASTVDVFGEWERLPADRVGITPGDYMLDLLITEESFHESDEHAGFWAHAMHGVAPFTILPLTIETAVEPVHAAAPTQIAVQWGASTGIVLAASAYWQITNVVVNGAEHGVTNAWSFDLITNDQRVVVQMTPLTAAYGVPQWWLAEWLPDWTNDFDWAATNDIDGDGVLTWEEHLGGSHPGLRDSRFEISDQRIFDGSNGLTWVSVHRDPALPGFSIARTTNLVGVWSILVSNLHAAVDGTNIWYDGEPPAGGGVYYRVVAPAGL
ncbi:MAG: hypothetical protein O2901_00590 [Verrucomicrobia bacterium]|nr:hypothetical protein [Verrucomicrobiota bacterium]